MNREEFLKKCSYGCLGLAGTSLFLQGCSAPKYLNAEIQNDYLVVPLDAFNSETSTGNFVVVQNSELSYPIALFKQSETEYKALLMRCTHQGTELRLYGDRFECPAHGSEFSGTGSVESGPASKELWAFPVQVEDNQLKIDLR